MATTSAYVSITPASIYSSLTRFLLRADLGSSDSFKVRFPAGFQPYTLESDGSFEIRHESNSTEITLTPRADRKQVSLRCLIPNAVTDCGYAFYPLISTRLFMGFVVDSVQSLIVHARLPKSCGAYLAYSQIKVGEETYDCKEESAKINKDLKHDFRGVSPATSSLAAIVDEVPEKETEIKVDIHFRRRTLFALGVILVPLLLGFPLIVVWGFPGLDAITRISFSISAVPVLFGLWYRYASELQEPLSLFNAIWLLSVIIWIGYILVLAAYSLPLGIAIIPYAIWIVYLMSSIASFRHHPIQAKMPRLLRWFDALYRRIYISFDKIYYKETGFREPAAR